jgi:hypothetical protein
MGRDGYISPQIIFSFEATHEVVTLKIPNGHHAIVDIRKLTEYALNIEHPVGKHKARVFEAVLGLTSDDAKYLQSVLLKVVQELDAELGQEDDYGKRYIIDFEIESRVGKGTIRSSWIIRADEDFPRLTSCYVLQR